MSLIETEIRRVMGSTNGTTFASLVYGKNIAPAAKWKDTTVIEEEIALNVQLFSNINAATSVYANAVKKSASKLGGQPINFEPKSTYYKHDTSCYSIVEHKDSGKKYLYCIVNKIISRKFKINGVDADEKTVSKFLTPSASKKLLDPTSTVFNLEKNFEHNVHVRVITLSNLKSITAMKETLSF